MATEIVIPDDLPRRRLARKVAERINQLGGTPNFNPDRLATRSSQHIEGSNLVEMIEETPMCRPNIPAAGPMSPRNRLPSLY